MNGAYFPHASYPTRSTGPVNLNHPSPIYESYGPYPTHPYYVPVDSRLPPARFPPPTGPLPPLHPQAPPAMMAVPPSHPPPPIGAPAPIMPFYHPYATFSGSPAIQHPGTPQIPAYMPSQYPDGAALAQYTPASHPIMVSYNLPSRTQQLAIAPGQAPILRNIG